MRRRRYRRNASGFSDAEMIIGVVVAGGLVWLGYEAYQAMKQGANAVNAGFANLEAAVAAFKNSVVAGVTSPYTTFEQWITGGSGAPSSSGTTTFPGFGGSASSSSDGSSDSSDTSGGGSSF